MASQQTEDPDAPGTGTGTEAPPAEAPRSTDDKLEKAPAPRRTTIDALETRALVQEMQSLVGGFLDKAYQPTRDEVMLRFRAPEVGRRDLLFHRGRYLCFTEHSPENPTHPPGFAMALRKHACGGKVFKIEQAGFDRVIHIWVQRKEGSFQIVMELLGDGNCILVRPDGRIFVPLVQEAWASRTIRSGQPYVPPPPRDDPFTFDEVAFLERLGADADRETVRALAAGVGVGGPVAEEILARLDMDKKRPVGALDETDQRRIWETWQALSTEALARDAPAELLLDEERPIDAAPYQSAVFRREIAKDPKRSIRPVPTFSNALDVLFLSGRKAHQVRESVAAVDSHVTKLERQRRAQVEAVDRFQREIGEKQIQGDLLFAHYAAVERIIGGMLAARKDHDWKEIQRRIEEGRKAGNPDAQLVKRIEPHQGIVVVRLADTEGAEHDVRLDITKSVTENAQAAYERSKQARSKLAGAREALESTLVRMEKASVDRSSAEAAAEEAMRREDILVTGNRHHWFEAFRWFWTTSDELVVGGRDAGTNDRVVKKHLEDGDRYVHADLHGAPSLVVKAPGKDQGPSDEGLRQAAQAAVTFSRAFGTAGSGDAYWVSPPQVSKTPQAGEFLPRGAFIVRGERNWFRKMPLESAVGLVWLDGDGRPSAPPADEQAPGALRPKLMGGPPEAVHRHCTRWADVVSGDTPRKTVVRHLARAFSAHPDAVERALPVGDLRIRDVKGITLEAGEGDA